MSLNAVLGMAASNEEPAVIERLKLEIAALGNAMESKPRQLSVSRSASTPLERRYRLIRPTWILLAQGSSNVRVRPSSTIHTSWRSHPGPLLRRGPFLKMIGDGTPGEILKQLDEIDEAESGFQQKTGTSTAA